MRRWRASACAVLAAALLVGAPPARAQAAGAQAAAAEQARQQASAAAAELDALTARLAEQVEAEEQALRSVGTGVQASVAALADAQSAAAGAAQARARHGRTVRALYASGGELGVLVSVLGSASLEELAGRHLMAQRVLRTAADTSRAATTTMAEASERAAAADAEVGDRLATASDVTDATRAVEETLRQARARLDALGAEAARLTAVEEARRRWEAAEREAAAVRAAAATSVGQRVSAIGVPEGYQGLYQRAAQTCPGLRWTLLAAVGQVESRHGVTNGPSSAGAVGPMQFMPATFAAFGVDGDGDGIADPWSPADAVLSAARYLCHHGAGADTPETDRRALLRYNNAGWYVDLVLGVEADLVARAGAGG